MTKPISRLPCPTCHAVTDCDCIDSRLLSDGTRRRRYKCRRCCNRFTTLAGDDGRETVSNRPPGQPVKQPVIQPPRPSRKRPNDLDRLRWLLVESARIDVIYRGRLSEATHKLAGEVRAMKGA